MTIIRVWAARFLLPCLLAIGYCLLPSAAWGCPPGMFQTGSRDFIACAPIPGYNQGGDSSGDESKSTSQTGATYTRPIQPSYMAAVTHIDTSSYWVSRAHWTADSANKRALAACKAAMGDGCVLNETVYGYGPFGVMIDAMGLRWIKSGADVPKGTPESIRYQALAIQCLKSSFGCEFEEVIWQGAIPEDEVPPANFVTDNFPLYGVKRHRWALLAKPEGEPPPAWQNKAWLMSGSQNSAEARKAVLDRCRADSGLSCAIDAYVANGVLVRFVDAKGKAGWTSAVTKRVVEPLGSYRRKKPKIDPASVAARVERLCLVKPCKVIATYDAPTQRMQVIEDVKYPNHLHASLLIIGRWSLR